MAADGGKELAVITFARMIADKIREESRGPDFDFERARQAWDKDYQRCKTYGEKLLSHFDDPDQVWRLWKEGAFSGRNGATRRLFFNVKGIRLPSGERKLTEAIKAFLGNRFEELEAEHRAAAEAADKQAAADLKAIADELRESTEKAIRAGEAVTPEALIFVAKTLGLNVHPRTNGWMRKNLVKVNADFAECLSAVSGEKVAPSVEIYRNCKELLCVNPVQEAAGMEKSAALFEFRPRLDESNPQGDS